MDQRPEPRRGRWLVASVAAIVVLFAGEGMARVLSSKLPAPLRWHSYETQRKVELMDARQASGGADVVFVGTSLVNTGIDPAVVGERLGGSVTAFNAALSSGIPDLIDPWIKDVVIPRLHPKVVVIGLSSFDLSDATFAFSDAYRDSPGGRRAAGKDDFLEKVDWWLTDHSDLWADRFALRDPGTLFDAVRLRDAAPDPEAAALDANGRSTFKQTQRFDEAPRGFGAQVEQWSVGTRNVTALEDVIETVRSTGAAVVLVSMPVTNEFVLRHPHQENDYVTFRAKLTEVADRGGATALFFDTERDHTWFADQVHLNASGARAFSAQLADALQAIVRTGSR